MATRTFDELYADAMRHYQAQEFDQALEILTREGAAFPDDLHMVLYLRSCLAARVGQTDLALNLLQEALDNGVWYNREVMRGSPSWQVLQGMPEFERMVEICRVREEEVHGEPELLVSEPEGGLRAGEKYPLFLALHGNGSNGRQALNGWQSLVSKGWLLAAAQSSQVISTNMFIWDNQETALQELKEHYEQICKDYPIDTGKVTVAGFSMGGETALRAVLSGTIPAQGFILLGPGGPTIDAPDGYLSLIEEGKRRGLRGYIVMGDADALIVPEALQNLVALLNMRGIPCELETISGLGHEYPPDLEPVIERALNFVLR
jgi:predicted esterase